MDEKAASACNVPLGIGAAIRHDHIKKAACCHALLGNAATTIFGAVVEIVHVVTICNHLRFLGLMCITVTGKYLLDPQLEVRWQRQLSMIHCWVRPGLWHRGDLGRKAVTASRVRFGELQNFV